MTTTKYIQPNKYWETNERANDRKTNCPMTVSVRECTATSVLQPQNSYRTKLTKRVGKQETQKCIWHKFNEFILRVHLQQWQANVQFVQGIHTLTRGRSVVWVWSSGIGIYFCPARHSSCGSVSGCAWKRVRALCQKKIAVAMHFLKENEGNMGKYKFENK